MKVTIHSKRRVFDGFFKIDEAEISHERFNGQSTARLHRLCFERGDSVAAVIFNRNSGKAVLVNQFRYPTYEKGPGWTLETVAGIIEAEEKPEDALRREIMEESGYRPEIVEHIATFYLSPGGSSERVMLYYAEVANDNKPARGGGVEQEGEDIEVIEMSLEDLERAVSGDAIQDAKTLVGIQWLLKRWHVDRSRTPSSASAA